MTSLPGPSATPNASGGADIDIPLINLSGLQTVVADVETGVTSGADPSEWDPISVGIEDKPDQCASGEGSAAPSKEGSGGACGVRAQ